MMNGILMSEGIDAVSVPAIRAAEFNSRMVDFYASRDATAMMAFVLECHPEIAQIRQLNPELSQVRDLPNIRNFSLGDSMKRANADEHSTRQGQPDATANPRTAPVNESRIRPSSLDELQQRAAEDWRREYRGNRTNEPGARADSPPEKDHAADEKKQPVRDAGLDLDPEG